MSQAGIVDIEGANPQIPTSFDTNSGTAIPIANVLEILGDTVANGTYAEPTFVTGSGNTVIINMQVGTEITGSPVDSNDAGIVSFDDTAFAVSANGYVTLIGGGGATTNIGVDASTFPGTDPVVPSGGNIVMTGAQVASGTVGANVVRTNSLAANTVTLEIQRSSAVAAPDMLNNGVAHFDSTSFAVDASGFVTLKTGGFLWNNVTAASASMVAENGYQTNNAGVVTLTLPATASTTFGDTIKIMGFGAGGWSIAQLAGQQIIVSSASSTVGVGGSVASTNRYDAIELVCSSTTGTWRAVSFVGNLTVT